MKVAVLWFDRADNGESDEYYGTFVDIQAAERRADEESGEDQDYRKSFYVTEEPVQS